MSSADLHSYEVKVHGFWAQVQDFSQRVNTTGQNIDRAVVLYRFLDQVRSQSADDGAALLLICLISSIGYQSAYNQWRLVRKFVPQSRWFDTSAPPTTPSSRPPVVRLTACIGARRRWGTERVSILFCMLDLWRRGFFVHVTLYCRRGV